MYQVHLNCFIKGPARPHYKTILELLKRQGAQLNPNKAGELLEKLIERQLTEVEDLQELSGTVDFLQAQGGAIPAANALVLLEKFIQKERGTSVWDSKDKQEEEKKLQFYIIDLLHRHSQGATSRQKATDLLQQAIEKAQGPKIYQVLLQQGANPNIIQVKRDYADKKVPLLHYVNEKRHEEDFEGLLHELINNPITDINIIGEHNFSIAMENAYYAQGSTAIMDALLIRPDLDLNTTKGDHVGVKGYTLIEVVAKNCMPDPSGGHDWQITSAIEDSKRWLDILKKMKAHPKCQISSENYQRAYQDYYELLLRFQHINHQQEALEIAQEALNIIKSGLTKS